MRSRNRGGDRWTAGWLPGALCALGLAALLPASAAAKCENSADSQTVNPGDNLRAILFASTDCTITVNAGTYTASTANGADGIFHLLTGVVVRSASGPASTVLAVPGSVYAVIIEAPNVTLDGFTLQGGAGGVRVSSTSGATLRNLIVNTTNGTAHGIDLINTQGSVVDSCTVVTAGVNGIFLENGSHDNIVMNSAVQSTAFGHAIAVQGPNNVIVGNTVSGSAFHGILLNSASGPALAPPGSSWNRVERNAISGHKVDGITLSDGSNFNYLGLNTAVSSSYNPITKPTPNPTSGVGVWLNNASNGNYVFGNDLSGSPENGIDVLISTSEYLEGNRVHANFHGGIWVANYLVAGTGTASSPAPRDIVIHDNEVFFNTSNAQVNLEGVTNADVAYNYLSGAEGATLAGAFTGGVKAAAGGLSTRGANVATSGFTVYENTITDVETRAYVDGTSTGGRFFRNRFLNGSNNPSQPAGRRGVTYSLFPAAVSWDGWFLGGNHWSEFTAANANPDYAHPYRGFIYDNVHGIDGKGPYVDKLPYASESLPTAFAPYSVSVLEPTAGRVLAAGTKKTIRWLARGCVLVDISYASGGLGLTPIADAYPNVGYYFWNVPSAGYRDDYFVRVECLDSHGNPVSVSDDSAAFTIATNDLVLLNPGRASRAVNGGSLRVAWKKSSAVGNVNVFVRTEGGSETQVATNATGTFTDVTLPGSVSSSSQVTIRIQDAGNAGRQDSVDGTFMVRGTTPAFTTALAGQGLRIGSIQTLEWVGRQDSYTVDLDLLEGGNVAKSIAKNLPDFGRYTWLVPEMWHSDSRIRATFKDQNGTVVGTAVSGSFKVLYTTTPGTAVNRYRLYSPVTLEHLFTTDQNEYNVLGASGGTWLQESVASKLHNGPTSVGGVEATPYYRLYDFASRWHHWTTDRNEYFTLRENTGRYNAEGVDGYIFQTQVSGTVPWYRLLYVGIPGLHHWTADQNERNVLVGSGFWVEEARQYVFP